MLAISSEKPAQKCDILGPGSSLICVSYFLLAEWHLFWSVLTAFHATQWLCRPRRWHRGMEALIWCRASGTSHQLYQEQHAAS